MYNDILAAVVRRLKELFGEDCGIFTEPVGQGTNGPCFFVCLQESTEKSMVGLRHFRKTEVLIRYLPQETPQTLREMNQAAEILMDGMEYITLTDGSRLRGTGRSIRPDLDERLRGTGLSAKTDPETRALTFRVSYNMFVIKAGQEETTMETIEIEKGMVK